MRIALLAPALLAAALPQSTPSAIEAALADPARADQAGDDARRQAAAVLAFAGVRPGWTVIDFLPGQGYWTRIFAGLVGPKGRVIAMWPAAGARRAEAVLPGLRARGLANVVLDVQPGQTPQVAQPVDLFWTAQNYHDIPEGLRAAFNAAVFAALKPGGVYLVIDHADAKGAMPSVPPRHRIDPAVVRSQVTSVGFRFAGQSAALANPADDRRRSVFDPAIRGRTDQFVFKFVKPR
jgi:predicted methyltransferase